MLNRDRVKPHKINDAKYDQFFTIKRDWYKIYEDKLKGINTEKFIPDFPVNKEIKFDKNKMIKAIEYGMIILIKYKGEKDKWKGGRERTIAPMVMGVNKNTGNLLIRAFHLDGYSVAERSNTKKVWRLFKASNIKTMMFIGDFFRLPPAGYKMNDRVMTETTIARANFNKIRKNQHKLVQADKIRKAEDEDVTKKKHLATSIQIKDTETILDLKNPWENEFMDKKMKKEIKLTFLKSIFGNDYIAIIGALGTRGRTVKVFDENKKLIGAYKTLESFKGDQIHYKKQVKGKNEYKLYTFMGVID